MAPPNGTIERTKLQAWLNFFSSEMHKGGFSPLFYKGVPEDGREVFRARLKARFTHLDRHLSANKYLMGSDYSVADAHFFVHHTMRPDVRGGIHLRGGSDDRRRMHARGQHRFRKK